jgi:hypothetical protein
MSVLWAKIALIRLSLASIPVFKAVIREMMRPIRGFLALHGVSRSGIADLMRRPRCSLVVIRGALRLFRGCRAEVATSLHFSAFCLSAFGNTISACRGEASHVRSSGR